nr:hypothetical protein [Bacteroidota bacterium]
MTQGDTHVELARIQKEIQDALALDSQSLVFEYRETEGNTRLDLVTVNPKHNQSFLFHWTVGID